MNSFNLFSSISKKNFNKIKKPSTLDLDRSDYARINFSEINFNYASLSGTDFSNANLNKASLIWTDINEA